METGSRTGGPGTLRKEVISSVSADKVNNNNNNSKNNKNNNNNAHDGSSNTKKVIPQQSRHLGSSSSATEIQSSQVQSSSVPSSSVLLSPQNHLVSSSKLSEKQGNPNSRAAAPADAAAAPATAGQKGPLETWASLSSPSQPPPDQANFSVGFANKTSPTKKISAQNLNTGLPPTCSLTSSSSNKQRRRQKQDSSSLYQIENILATDSENEVEIVDLSVSIENQKIRDRIHIPPAVVVTKPSKKRSKMASADTNALQTIVSNAATSFKVESPLASRKSLARENQPQHNSAYHHSYDKYFSTTALHKLNDAVYSPNSIPRRPTSQMDLSNLTGSARHGKSSAPVSGSAAIASRSASRSALQTDAAASPIEAFAPLLFRTASRVWEDIQETKGQSWLGTRQSSTNLYAHDPEDGGESDEEDEYSRARNALAHRQTRGASKPRAEEYNLLLRMAQEEAELGSSKPRFVPGGSDEEDEDEEEELVYSDILMPQVPLDTSTIKPSTNKVIAAIDWILGVGHDQEASLFTDIYYSDKPAPTRAEKLQQRDDEQGINLDVALVLGAISYIF